MDEARRGQQRRDALRRLDFLLRSKLLAVGGRGWDCSELPRCWCRQRAGCSSWRDREGRLASKEAANGRCPRRLLDALLLRCLQSELPAGMRVLRVRGGQAWVAGGGGQYKAQLTLVPAPRDDVTLAKYRPPGEAEEAEGKHVLEATFRHTLLASVPWWHFDQPSLLCCVSAVAPVHAPSRLADGSLLRRCPVCCCRCYQRGA